MIFFSEGLSCSEGSIPLPIDMENYPEGLEILSPNYPEDRYENGHNCYWHIQAPEGQRIRADILDFEVRSFIRLIDLHIK